MRSALMVDLVQVQRVNGETKDFYLLRPERRGQHAALEVFASQRIVGHLHAMLHRQVKGSWRFAAAGNAPRGGSI